MGGGGYALAYSKYTDFNSKDDDYARIGVLA
jgi:hypothetical protein